MAARVYENFVSTKLTAQLLAAGTTINVTAGDGVKFAGANGSDWIIATLRRMSGFKDVAHEIVKVTNRATDALTVVRAQESTSALQFEIGDQIDIDFTKTSMADAATAAAAAVFADNETPSGTVNGSNVTFTLAFTPSPAASLQFFINGLLQYAGGVHYTLTGNSIATTVGATPQTGDLLRAFYRH